MSLLPRISSLFRNLGRRGKVERDLAAEVDSYVDLSTQRKIETGLTEPEARGGAGGGIGGGVQV
jgi:hypothetical protein